MAGLLGRVGFARRIAKSLDHLGAYGLFNHGLLRRPADRFAPALSHLTIDQVVHQIPRNISSEMLAAPSDQYPFDAALVGVVHVSFQPVATEHVPCDLDHDVIGVGARVLAVAREALQA